MTLAIRPKSTKPGQLAGNPKYCTIKEARSIPRDGWRWAEAHDAAFPEVDPGVRVYAGNFLIQIPLPPLRIGSLILTEDSRDNIIARTQIGIVRSLGPLAFHNHSTLEAWPSGNWFDVGDFVRFPMYGGDRWWGDIPDSREKVMFVLLRDVHASATVVKDPLKIKAYL